MILETAATLSRSWSRSTLNARVRSNVFHAELIKLVKKLFALSCLQCAAVICEQRLTSLPLVRLRTQDDDGRKRSSSLKIERMVEVHVVPAKVLMTKGQPHMRPFDCLTT